MPNHSSQSNRSAAVQPQTETGNEYRKLPAVDTLLRSPQIDLLVAEYGQAEVTSVARRLLEQTREQIAQGASAPVADEWPRRIHDQLVKRQRPSLVPVINATGVIIHTNLGRAPLSTAARAAIDAVGAGYSNLEYDLDVGARGSRNDHPRHLLADLVGAEDVLVVNNNAAAVYFVLAALCSGREVLVSRGQLVEIGGGFRIPDVLQQSGCTLVEVGTTNRTHLRDFAAAIGPETGAVMRIHSSNFRQVGFVTQPPMAEIADLVHAAPRPEGDPLLLIDDLGSGTLLDVGAYGLMPEPTVTESLQAGADLVTFSGDKLLGGPQAGIIVGRAELIGRLRRHPLARALRVDKMTLAALDATLRSYQRNRAEAEVPVWMMISAPLEALQQRAEGWRQVLRSAGIPALCIEGESAVGGGSLPGETLPTYLLAIPVDSVNAVADSLRRQEIPIVCRIQQDRLLFDPRTVLPDQDALLVATLKELL